MEINATTVIVAALGAGGLGAILREVFSGLTRISRGISARESTRKTDLVTLRQEAEERAADASHRADVSDVNLRALQRWAAGLERRLILAGIEYDDAPTLETTISPAQLRQLREGAP